MAHETNQSTQSTLRLMTWLTPVFPTGGFAYSSGLESAYATGAITTAADLSSWIQVVLSSGSAWNDAILCAQSWRGTQDVAYLATYVEALCTGHERYTETVDQGAAFIAAARPWSGAVVFPDPCPLPIAVGLVARVNDVPLKLAVAAHIHSFLSNQIQAALRLGRIGQDDGLQIVADLESLVGETAARAAEADLDALGGSAFTADFLSLDHETREPRIFRT
ncbi:MAG: urease accessory UreF family protein [Pseudomonadota bacterium]